MKLHVFPTKPRRSNRRRVKQRRSRVNLCSCCYSTVDSPGLRPCCRRRRRLHSGRSSIPPSEAIDTKFDFNSIVKRRGAFSSVIVVREARRSRYRRRRRDVRGVAEYQWDSLA